MLNDYRHKLGQCESGLCECGTALPTSVSTLRRREDYTIVCLFVCLFVALRPKSTAMVIAGRSVHLNTFFPGQA